MKRFLLPLLLALAACSPSVEDDTCTPGTLGCEPIDGYFCDEGRPSPAGVCYDVVEADESLDECADYATEVSDPVDQIGGRRFCLPMCNIADVDSCTAEATGFDHDLTCLDIDGTTVCGLAEAPGW